MTNKTTYEGNISDLKFDDKNFNKHTKRGMEMLRTSVGDNGFGRSILVDKDNNIIAGNGIVETAASLDKHKIRVVETNGDELVVVKRTDVSINSQQGREMALADNASAAVDLDWDEDALKEVAMEFDMDFDKYGLDLHAFDDDDESENHAPDAGEVKEDEYDEDLTTAPQKAKKGQIWQCGGHRVICGDSTDPDTIARLMMGEQADLLLTDPPYNVAYTGGPRGGKVERDAIANDNMASEQFREFLTKCLHNACEHMKCGAAYYIWYAISEHTNFTESTMAAGLKISEYLLWVKSQLVLGRLDYHYRHEPCVYGWKPGAAHHWYSDRKQSTVLEYPKPIKSVDHPTMKPVPMFAYQMGNSTQQGDIVLDIFGGSGTTMVAAQQLGRKARLVEFEEKYVNVIIDRYIALTGSSDDVFLLTEDGNRIAYKDVPST